MEFVFTIPAPPVSFVFGIANATLGSGGGVATVENSDATYSDTVNGGDTLVLPDETFYFQIDGVTVATEIEPALSTQTFNINWI